MAHVWRLMGESAEWYATALDGDVFALEADSPRRVAGATPAGESSLLLHRVDEPAGAIWTLIVGRGRRVLINGGSTPLGLVTLSDRDEIRSADAAPLFFSTETLACVTPFPASAARGLCPRCKQHIDGGTAAVCCPGCGLWYHASDEFPCWTYAPQCSTCPQDTALDTGFRWTPEEL